MEDGVVFYGPSVFYQYCLHDQKEGVPETVGAFGQIRPLIAGETWTGGPAQPAPALLDCAVGLSRESPLVFCSARARIPARSAHMVSAWAGLSVPSRRKSTSARSWAGPARGALASPSRAGRRSTWAMAW
jgi:hypothetical protein